MLGPLSFPVTVVRALTALPVYAARYVSMVEPADRYW